MAKKKRKPYKLDANIEGLVDALNTLPGIETIASCGGHAKNKDGDGCGEGEKVNA